MPNSEANKEKLVLGLAGEMLSGKTTAANFFETTFKARNIRFSIFLNRILDILDLPQSRENQQSLITALRANYGAAVLAVPVVEAISKSKDSFILIDGFRKKEEIEKLREIPNFKLLYIKASLEQRYARLKERTEKVGENLLTIEEFEERERAESDKDIKALEQFADCIIENSGSVEDLKLKLSAYFTTGLC